MVDLDNSDSDSDTYWERPRRLRSDRILGGVAAGLAAWLGIPVVAVRIFFVVTALLNGIGALVYGALWLALPTDEPRSEGNRQLRMLAAIGLGVTAALTLLDRFDLPSSGVLLPVLLVGIGLALWRPSPRHHPPPPPRQTDPDGAPDDPTAVLDVPGTADATAPVIERQRRLRRPRDRAPREPKPSSPLPRITIAVAFAALAIALLFDRSDAFELTLSRGLSFLLLLIGAALLVGARYGRARWLVILAVPMAVALPVATTLSSLDVDPFAHWGTRTHFVRNSTDLAPSYRHGMGSVTVDLGPFTADGGSYRTDIRNAIGSINLYVPQRMQVVLHARVGAGNITVDDYRLIAPPNRSVMQQRLAEEDGREIEVNTTIPGEAGAGSITIDATTGLGTIRVIRQPARSVSTTPAVTTTMPSTSATTTTIVATTTPLASTTIETR